MAGEKNDYTTFFALSALETDYLGSFASGGP